ncbi:MAG: NlpC/P60 family protein [Bacteriovoracaceae bacterium]|nr:NlpC/P60 family protein [Bacteroidota bacterium]
MITLFDHKPLRFYRGGFSFLVFALSFWLIGCGTSSPRFAGKDSGKSESKKAKKGNIRFSSKVIEEETKEDDKKVDLKSVELRFSSVKPSTVPVAPKKETVDSKRTEDATPGSFERQKMMDAILAWMGTPYEYGGESKSGIDCSAFSREIFRTSGGMNLPRSTEEQVKLGISVSQENLKFGDLIFFNTTGQNPSHVGIYIGDDMFAHASVSFGVTLSSLYSSYYKKRYTEARRVIQ